MFTAVSPSRTNASAPGAFVWPWGSNKPRQSSLPSVSLPSVMMMQRIPAGRHTAFPPSLKSATFQPDAFGSPCEEYWISTSPSAKALKSSATEVAASPEAYSENGNSSVASCSFACAPTRWTGIVCPAEGAKEAEGADNPLPPFITVSPSARASSPKTKAAKHAANTANRFMRHSPRRFSLPPGAWQEIHAPPENDTNHSCPVLNRNLRAV